MPRGACHISRNEEERQWRKVTVLEKGACHKITAFLNLVPLPPSNLKRRGNGSRESE